MKIWIHLWMIFHMLAKICHMKLIKDKLSGSLNRMANHLTVGFFVFFWAFWATLSWAFCWVPLSLLTTFLSPCFLAIAAFFLYLIYLIAYSASAFLSSGLAVFIFLIASKVTPSIALSILRALALLALPVSDSLIFLWSLLQAVVHLSLWALSFLCQWGIYLRLKFLVLLERYKKGLPSLATYLIPFPGYIFHSLNVQSSVLITIMLKNY